jgi:hypothetical protein
MFGTTPNKKMQKETFNYLKRGKRDGAEDRRNENNLNSSRMN